MENTEKRWGVDPADIKDEKASKKFRKMYKRAKSKMDLRTKGHSFFSKVSHMQNLYEDNDKTFSEGSTQAIKRKIRAETIQRVPDGEIKTPFDKNSIEQTEIEFLFKNKIMKSEYDGQDRLKDLWRTFDASYDYGYACVRTGFEKDSDGDIRTTYKLIQWNDILPAPDCDFIEQANWYIVREYISAADLHELLDDNGNVTDATYNEDVVHYLIENEIKDGQEPNSIPLQDKKHSAMKTESIVVWTIYIRGKKEFKTFVPSVDAVLRTTKNYDPRLDVPLHFCILEPDPDFPLGCSSILWTLSQQQFADAFQTTAFQTLLLSANPPLMAYGNLANARLRMKPRALWQMGTNPNNKIEKYPVETTTITQYASILNNVSANMMKNLNVTESTVATDSQTMGYSATPQGVEQQRRDKSTTVNQYQKRIETFFCEWANHALRSYINAMTGEIEMTVDEETRRKVWDVESSQSKTDEMGMPIVESIINENKISIDFDKLKEGTIEFDVRSGSLIQGEKEEEQQNIQQLLVPVSQMLGNLSDKNRESFEDVIMQLVARLCELSDIDISAQTASSVQSQVMMNAMQRTMETVMQQQQQMQGMQQQLDQMRGGQPQMQPGMQQQDQQMPMQQQQQQQQQVSQEQAPAQQSQPTPLEMAAEQAQQNAPQQMATAPQQPEVNTEFPPTAEGLV